jgi:hypothetical protein
MEGNLLVFASAVFLELLASVDATVVDVVMGDVLVPADERSIGAERGVVATRLPERAITVLVEGINTSNPASEVDVDEVAIMGTLSFGALPVPAVLGVLGVRFLTIAVVLASGIIVVAIDVRLRTESNTIFGLDPLSKALLGESRALGKGVPCDSLLGVCRQENLFSELSHADRKVVLVQAEHAKLGLLLA